MSLATLTADVLALNNQVTSLLATVHAQAAYVQNAVASAINVTQSTLRTTTKTVTALAQGQSVDFILDTATAEFSELMNVMYGYHSQTASTVPYHIQFIVQTAALAETVAYSGISTVGNFRNTVPVTIMKAVSTDKVILRVTNLGTAALTGLTIDMFNMTIAPNLINVLKTPVLTFTTNADLLAATLTREVSMVVPLLQFNTVATTILGIAVTAGATDKYSIQIVTRDALSVDTLVYQTAILTGPFHDNLPFTVIKGLASDGVYVRITNQGTTAIPALTFNAYTLGIS